VDFTSAELSPNGRIVAACDNNGSVQLFADSFQVSCNEGYLDPVDPHVGPIVLPPEDPEDLWEVDSTPLGQPSLVVAQPFDGLVDAEAELSLVRAWG
jgi:hypothetical protein